MLNAAAASARRNWYLASLGIVRYVPRGEMVSAGAAAGEEPLRGSASREDVAPLGVVGEVAGGEAVLRALGGTDIIAASPAPAERRDRDRPRVDLGGSAAVVSATPLPAARASQSDDEPFLCRIGFWQPASRVAVLSAMPPGQRPTAVQITMLTNLLKAIGALGQELPAVDLIDWPPSSGLGLQGGASLAAARDYLGVFLQAKQRLRNFETVLLMGDIATRVCGDDEPFTAGRQLDLPWGARAIATHSLHDMEETPALKAETWQAIRFLAG